MTRQSRHVFEVHIGRGRRGLDKIKKVNNNIHSDNSENEVNNAYSIVALENREMWSNKAKIRRTYS